MSPTGQEGQGKGLSLFSDTILSRTLLLFALFRQGNGGSERFMGPEACSPWWHKVGCDPSWPILPPSTSILYPVCGVFEGFLLHSHFIGCEGLVYN